MSNITIDARVSGFDNQGPCRILAIAVPERGIILVSSEAQYYGDAVKDKSNTIIVVDTPSHFKDWQLCFEQELHLAQAVRCYQDAKRANRIKLESAIKKYDPEGVLQIKKVDKHGTEFEFNTSGLMNGHMAVLLVAWAANRVALGHTIAGSIAGEPDAPSDDDDDDSMMPFSLG